MCPLGFIFLPDWLNHLQISALEVCKQIKKLYAASEIPPPTTTWKYVK